MVIDPDEEPEYEPVPTYVLAALCLGFWLLVLMCACAPIQRPAVAWHLGHYGWRAPHISYQGDPPPGAPRPV